MRPAPKLVAPPPFAQHYPAHEHSRSFADAEGPRRGTSVFDEISTGAADDLNKAADIARNMVPRFGMHDKLGQVTYETPRPTFLGEDAFAHLGGMRVRRRRGARNPPAEPQPAR